MKKISILSIAIAAAIPHLAMGSNMPEFVKDDPSQFYVPERDTITFELSEKDKRIVENAQRNYEFLQDLAVRDIERLKKLGNKDSGWMIEEINLRLAQAELLRQRALADIKTNINNPINIIMKPEHAERSAQSRQRRDIDDAVLGDDPAAIAEAMMNATKHLDVEKSDDEDETEKKFDLAKMDHDIHVNTGRLIVNELAIGSNSAKIGKNSSDMQIVQEQVKKTQTELGETEAFVNDFAGKQQRVNVASEALSRQIVQDNMKQEAHLTNLDAQTKSHFETLNSHADTLDERGPMISDNTSNIAQNAQNIGVNAQNIGVNGQKIEQHTAQIETHRTHINNNTVKNHQQDLQIKRAEAVFKDLDENVPNFTKQVIKNKNDISGNRELINGLQAQYENFKNDYNDFKKTTNTAIAGIAAIATLPQPYGVGKANIAFGVGHYKSETALSVGMGYRASEQLTFRFGGSVGNKFKHPVVSAGLGYEF